MPIPGPRVNCCITNNKKLLSCSPSIVASVQEKNKTIGNARPSFKPLSITSVRRSRAGTRALLITACPSAASVGAKIDATNATAKIDQSRSNTLATPTPNKTARGKPINNIR